LQVIEIYSHQLLKYKWTDFSSKQNSFYFTKSSRGPDPTTQGCMYDTPVVGVPLPKYYYW